MICEYSENRNNNGSCYLHCKINNFPCSFFRFCKVENKLKMTDGYFTCVVRKGESSMKERETVESIEVVSEKKVQMSKPNKVKTVVKFNKNNEAYFEINSYGFKFPSDKQRGENITVYFEGEFLTESFKIVDIK